MATLFSTKLVESQLPVLTRRSTILKRVMWAGIGIAIAGLIPALYFSYSAADVNSATHFAYDIPKSLIDWSGALPGQDEMLNDRVDYLGNAIFSILGPLTAMLGITGFMYTIYSVMRGEDISAAIRPLIMVLFATGAAYTIRGSLDIDNSDTTPSVESKLSGAFKQRDVESIIKVVKENPELLNSQVTGHTDVTKFFLDLGYLEIQKDIKEGHVDARKIESFVQSSYFSKSIKTFRPDALTAIEKAAYGHPVSERAEHYQTSVIEPEMRTKHMLATISASLVTLGFISGTGAFLLSRSIRRRVSFLQALLAGEAISQ